MDFDSSSKFISSLAKFLQSLCNGYVEFDSGVEVIGHIYLNVDTGKKIDYILNEKVCKTDENSVTFISNSFHAQPAEKQKPPEKPKQNVPAVTEPVAEDDQIVIMDESDKSFEQYSDNAQHNSSPHPKSRSQGASKRSYSQSFASSNRTSSKSSKFDSSLSLSTPNNGAHNSPHDITFSLNTPAESDLSRLSQSFPESGKDSFNSQERDVKPSLDKDLNVINVKQEYDPAADGQADGHSSISGYFGEVKNKKTKSNAEFCREYRARLKCDPSRFVARREASRLKSHIYRNKVVSEEEAERRRALARVRAKRFRDSKKSQLLVAYARKGYEV